MLLTPLMSESLPGRIQGISFESHGDSSRLQRAVGQTTSRHCASYWQRARQGIDLKVCLFSMMSPRTPGLLLTRITVQREYFNLTYPDLPYDELDFYVELVDWDVKLELFQSNKLGAVNLKIIGAPLSFLTHIQDLSIVALVLHVSLLGSWRALTRAGLLGRGQRLKVTSLCLLETSPS